MKPNVKHIALMKHTVSGHDRNWFGARKDSRFTELFQEIVDMGLAVKRPSPSWAIDEVMFRLNDEGKCYLKNLESDKS